MCVPKNGRKGREERRGNRMKEEDSGEDEERRGSREKRAEASKDEI